MTSDQPDWWRWPLWSWRNLAVTLLVATTLVGALGRVSALGEPTVDEAPATETTPLSSVGRSSSSNAPSALRPGPTPSSSRATPLDVALAFTEAWARPDADVDSWRSECSSFATARFIRLLSESSSASVPASRALGSAATVERSATSARVRVPTDGGAVLVSLERVRAEWLVDGIEPEESPALVDRPMG